MAESTRTAFLLLVGALLSQMERKTLVFDDVTQALLLGAMRKQFLPNDHMDELLTMAIRKNHLTRDEVVGAIESAIRELPGPPADRSGGGAPQSAAESDEIPKVGRPKTVIGKPNVTEICHRPRKGP